MSNSPNTFILLADRMQARVLDPNHVCQTFQKREQGDTGFFAISRRKADFRKPALMIQAIQANWQGSQNVKGTVA